MAPAFALNIDRITLVTMVADGTINLALAVFLFVLGIMTLTGSPRARNGHLLWAWLKFPAIALSFVATTAFTRALFQSAAATTVPPAPVFADSVAVAQSAIYAMLTLIYPVAILIVMRTKRVKEYYEAGAGRAVG